MVRNVDLPDQAVPPQLCRTGSLPPPENKNLSLSNVSLAMLDGVPRSIHFASGEGLLSTAGQAYQALCCEAQCKGWRLPYEGTRGRPLWKTFLIYPGNSPFFLGF